PAAGRVGSHDRAGGSVAAGERMQDLAQSRDAGETCLGGAAQCTVDYAGQGFGDLGASVSDRDGVGLEDHEQLVIVPLREGVDPVAGQEEVEGRGDRVLVDGRLGVAEVGDLFGGHVADRPGDLAREGQAAHRRVLVDPGEAEVGELHRVDPLGGGRDQEVVRL